MAELEQLTVGEAATVLGIARPTAYGCVRTGQWRVVRLGWRLVVPLVMRSPGSRPPRPPVLPRLAVWHLSAVLAPLSPALPVDLLATRSGLDVGRSSCERTWSGSGTDWLVPQAEQAGVSHIIDLNYQAALARSRRSRLRSPDFDAKPDGDEPRSSPNRPR